MKGTSRPRRKPWAKFLSKNHLLAWVRYHPLGEWLRAKIVADAYGSVINERQPVVVELYSDGGVNVYASKRVVVKVVQRPHATRPEAGPKLDEFVELSLPRKHRQIYAPGNLRAVGRCETVRPSDIMRRNRMLTCLDRLDEIGGRFGGR